MKKAIAAFCVLVIAFGIVLALESLGVLYIHGETTLTPSFQKAFDLTKLDPVRVREYLQREGGYNVIHKIDGGADSDSFLWFSMPEWPDHWIYDVRLDGSERVVEVPRYRMEWHFSFLPSRFLDEDREESIYFSRAYRPGVSCDIHILTSGGDVDMWVCGGSIGECREIAETKLLEFYREMLKSNIWQ
ncbi:MAG: hypothetical protein IJE08_05710 [Clostridia bacterium]|nr:hypothetical protein [Clostridia bacterium]